MQATITLARRVYIVLEVGQYDYGGSAITPGKDLKDFWYAGAKWQINFLNKLSRHKQTGYLWRTENGTE